MAEPAKRSDSVELLYARVLEVGVAVALPLLLVTFVLYVIGLPRPAVPLERLPEYWQLSSHDYLATIASAHLQQAEPLTGWNWLTQLHHGDYLTYVGIALLPVLTMICYLAIIPRLLRQGERLYAAIAGLESLVLLLAASGLLKAAGH